MTTKNKSMIVMVGLPGSGKSTARAIAAETGISNESFHYSTDDWLDAKAEELGSTYSEIFEEHIKTAEHEMKAGLKEALAEGKNVIWDQTNMTAKKRATILAKFKDYYRQCLCILPPMAKEQEDELARRLGSRPGKVIPNFVMRNMRNSFVLPTEAEGFDKVLYFDIMGKWVDREIAEKFFKSTLDK